MYLPPGDTLEATYYKGNLSKHQINKRNSVEMHQNARKREEKQEGEKRKRR